MKIILSDSRDNIFTHAGSWEDANIACKAIFKRQNYSDIYYAITFDDGREIGGAIDIEPESFHKPHQSTIFTWHLKTWWTNISRLPAPKYSLTQADIDECKVLLTYLPSVKK